MGRLHGLDCLGRFPLCAGGRALRTPPGGFKQGIHWDISADWLDPATHCRIGGVLLFYNVSPPRRPGKTHAGWAVYSCLAESWTVSPDSRVYKFHLRKGVKFHNGDLLTAEDCCFQLLGDTKPGRPSSSRPARKSGGGQSFPRAHPVQRTLSGLHGCSPSGSEFDRLDRT